MGFGVAVGAGPPLGLGVAVAFGEPPPPLGLGVAVADGRLVAEGEVDGVREFAGVTVEVEVFAVACWAQTSGR